MKLAEGKAKKRLKVSSFTFFGAVKQKLFWELRKNLMSKYFGWQSRIRYWETLTAWFWACTPSVLWPLHLSTFIPAWSYLPLVFNAGGRKIKEGLIAETTKTLFLQEVLPLFHAVHNVNKLQWKKKLIIAVNNKLHDKITLLAQLIMNTWTVVREREYIQRQRAFSGSKAAVAGFMKGLWTFQTKSVATLPLSSKTDLPACSSRR